MCQIGSRCQVWLLIPLRLKGMSHICLHRSIVHHECYKPGPFYLHIVLFWNGRASKFAISQILSFRYHRPKNRSHNYAFFDILWQISRSKVFSGWEIFCHITMIGLSSSIKIGTSRTRSMPGVLIYLWRTINFSENGEKWWFSDRRDPNFAIWQLRHLRTKKVCKVINIRLLYRGINPERYARGKGRRTLN